MRLLKRWSVITLVVITILAFAGPAAFQGYHGREAGAPFSAPLWLGGESPPTMKLNLADSEIFKEFRWDYDEPKGLSIKGTLSFEEAPKNGSLIWENPEKEIVLATIEERINKIDLDTRDLEFKLNIGLSPFGDAMEHLFPSRGSYSLIISGENVPSIVNLDLDITGSRYGLLGTDQRGRDVFRLFLLGIRVSLAVGLSSTLIATVIGLSLGLISGYAGGLTDSFIMRGVDILLSIPILPILMALAGIWGRGLFQLILILSLFSWMGTARTVRSMTLSLRDACYVEGLRGMGAKTSYILFRHLLPETLPLLLANIALGVPAAILAEASISFLGLSDPRIVSWGRMLHEAHSFGAFSSGAWWLLIPPGAGIALLCLIFLDIGKFLEEIADPRLREGIQQ